MKFVVTTDKRIELTKGYFAILNFKKGEYNEICCDK